MIGADRTGMDHRPVLAYLDRVGVITPTVCDAAVLRALHRAHQLTVPFENLSIHLAEPILLDERDLIDKIVRRRRGGFCYELNGAFALLLEALGARVSRVAARVYGEAGTACRHGRRVLKVIGLLGGMSWESSLVYERIINQEVRRRLGGVHSAELLVRSYDFADIEQLQSAGDWERAGRILAAGARQLEVAGAQMMVLCTNTMHRVADVIAAAIDIPFIHIADATAAAIKVARLKRVGLLGTRYTMERDFYRGHMEQVHHLSVLVPEEPDRRLVHQIIYDELVKGIVRAESRKLYVEVIGRLRERGAEGIIAGCTEIELLVQEGHVGIPYFPTTRLHAVAAVDAALASL